MNFNIKDLMIKAIANIATKNGITDKSEIAQVQDAVNSIIRDDVNVMTSKNAPVSTIIDEFINNDSIEIAFEAHLCPKAMRLLMVDAIKNDIKPFCKFYNEVVGIISNSYSREQLQKEYNYAIRRAHVAVDVKQILNEIDIFPNIQWECNFDNPTCKHHTQFDGRIWAATDDFWKNNLPCSTIDCDCSIYGTDEPITDNL